MYGNATVQCNEEGQWSGAQPICWSESILYYTPFPCSLDNLVESIIEAISSLLKIVDHPLFSFLQKSSLRCVSRVILITLVAM